jgi:D-alanine-D-alanine ligase
MHIGVTFDLQTDPRDEAQAEFDPPATIAAVRRALESLGHHVTLLGGALELLRGGPKPCCGIDLVFNLAEGRHGRCREAWAPTLLDLWNIPYVGSDPLALALGLDKVMSKRLALAEGIVTPRWICAGRPEKLPRSLPFPFPAIVKPRWEGSGRGIDPGAIVESPEALFARARRLFERCPGPLLIEEFIPHGELTVFVIGNHPPVAAPAIQRPVDPSSRLSCHLIHPRPAPPQPGAGPAAWEAPVPIDAPLDTAAGAMAVTMFNALGCRDVARVDLRVGERGRLYFLEINPLPSFDPELGLGLLAEYLGTTYAGLVGRILDAALERLGYLIKCK